MCVREKNGGARAGVSGVVGAAAEGFVNKGNGRVNPRFFFLFLISSLFGTLKRVLRKQILCHLSLSTRSPDDGKHDGVYNGATSEWREILGDVFPRL